MLAKPKINCIIEILIFAILASASAAAKPLAPPILGRSVNSIPNSAGGTNDAHHIKNDTPKFSYLPPIPVSISQLLQTNILNNRTTSSPAITYLLPNVKGWEKLSQILCTKELLSYLR